MYEEFWGFSRSPFDNVPDPGMYFKMHSSAERTVSELLFAVEEGNECMAVVVGEVGLGKTMVLRIVLDGLDPEKYRIAFVTNPDLTFPQLMREIIGQLKGEPCAIRSKETLLEEFNRILFETADRNKKVLLFIDEGNVIKGPNLESLRLLTNLQEDTRNLFTLVLAGQPRLAKRLQDPQRANLFQRVGIFSRLEPLGSVDLVRDYIGHRLERAGSTRKIFTDAAVESIYHHCEGVPRLINRLCKLCLKAGETNHLREIDTEVVDSVAATFEAISPSGKPRQAPVEADLPVTPAALDAPLLPPLPAPVVKDEQAVEPAPPAAQSPARLTEDQETSESAPPRERPPERVEVREREKSEALIRTFYELPSLAVQAAIENREENPSALGESYDECDRLRLKILNRTEPEKEPGALRKAFLRMSGRES